MKPLTIWLMLLVSFGFKGGAGQTQSGVIPNLQVLEQQMVQPIVQSIMHTIPIGERLTLQITGDTELAAWLSEQLIQHLLVKKFRVYNTATLDVNYIVRIKIDTVSITYFPMSHQWWGGVKEWQRKVQLKGRLTIISAKQELLTVQQLDTVFEDQFSGGWQKLETQQWSFTRGKVIDRSPWRRWVEPILISAATITVIALFFTVRSQ